MIDLRYEKLANNLLTYSVNLKKGENILIEVLGEDAIPVAKELIKKAEQIGANPQFNIINYELLRTMLKNSSEEQIKLYGQLDTQRMKQMDAYIGLRATSNTSELNDILDTDEGARYIGEFAFGLNPYVEKPIGDTLFDEKIKGSFHFTPGNSLEESDNGNRSSIHWDIVNIQTLEYGGGEIYFDDVLIRKDGIFVLPELECLNPENLK